jgi:hypothetical protein
MAVQDNFFIFVSIVQDWMNVENENISINHINQFIFNKLQRFLFWRFFADVSAHNQVEQRDGVEAALGIALPAVLVYFVSIQC